MLTDDFIRQLMNVGEVDILVGLPTFDNARSIEPVVQAIQAGILSNFPRERAVIINADGGSRDGTPDIVTRASIDDVRRSYNGRTLRTLHSITATYAKSPSSNAALRTILSAAELLRAKACAVIQPESTDMTPEWIPRLLNPVYREQLDFVTPIYRRHKFEGLLMRNLVYPMTRALFGQRIREPYASEFGFSGELGNHFLGQDIWTHESGRFGAEMDLTISALAGNYRIGQSFLGTKSRTEPQSEDLLPAIRQTAGSIFFALDTTFNVWSGKSGSSPIPTLGAESDVTFEPIRINSGRLREMFSVGVAELEPVLETILSAPTLSALQQISAEGENDFLYPNDLWVKTVYEFAASYHKTVMSRDHIIQALVPLYRGMIFTCLKQNADSTAADVESATENLCCEFERLKPYLLQLWNGGM